MTVLEVAKFIVQYFNNDPVKLIPEVDTTTKFKLPNRQGSLRVWRYRPHLLQVSYVGYRKQLPKQDDIVFMTVEEFLEIE